MDMNDIRTLKTRSLGIAYDSPEGYMIQDVPVLVSGVWTDSSVQTPLHYPPEVLKEFATNWANTTIWDKHHSDNIEDIIGEVKNPRYDDNKGAVVADLLFYVATEKQQNTVLMIKDKQIDGVSVEHTGREDFIDGMLILKTLEFHGLALVDNPACGSCRINEKPDNSNSIEEDVNMNDEQKLAFEELQTQVKELSAKLEALVIPGEPDMTGPTKTAEDQKTLSAAFDKQCETVKTLSAEIKELKNTTVSLTAGSTGSEYTKEDLYNDLSK